MTSKIYVNMLDRFMSGWGMARNGNSYYCIECDNREQADAIELAAKQRDEMRFIALSDRPRRKRSANDVVTIKHFSELGGPWLHYYAPARNARVEG